MDLPIGGAVRDEIARILEQVAKEGLDHPRNLDAAIDAIGSAFDAHETMRVTDTDGQYYLPGHNVGDAFYGFGPRITVDLGHFLCTDNG